MKKNNKYYLIYIILFFSILFILPKSFSNENINFLSLKNNEVNLRQGPSFEYPIKLIYKKNIYQSLFLAGLKRGDILKILKIILAGYMFHNYLKKNLL